MTDPKASAAEHERRMAELKSRHNGPRPDSPEAQRALRSAAFDDLFAYAQSLASDRDRLAKELEAMSGRVADLEAQNERLREKADRAFAAGIDAATGELGE